MANMQEWHLWIQNLIIIIIVLIMLRTYASKKVPVSIKIFVFYTWCMNLLSPSILALDYLISDYKTTDPPTKPDLNLSTHSSLVLYYWGTLFWGNLLSYL